MIFAESCLPLTNSPKERLSIGQGDVGGEIKMLMTLAILAKKGLRENRERGRERGGCACIVGNTHAHTHVHKTHLHTRMH